MKKLILLISFIIMSSSPLISYGNSEFTNDRFSTIISDDNIKGLDDLSLKSKVYEYLDKTNLLYCDGYNYLKKGKYSQNDNLLINNLFEICTFFVSGNFQDSFDKLSSISVDKSKIDGDIYLIYKLLEYSVYKVTVTVDGYNNMYKLDEVNVFLSENEEVLLSKFPISYYFRLGMGYFDLKDKDRFNSVYDKLSNLDYYLKPFFEFSYITLNGRDIKELDNVLKYERVILKDNSGPYLANNYFFVYKFLFDHYSKLGDSKKEADYFLKFQKELGLLGDYQTFKFLLGKKNLPEYESIIKENIDVQYYNFLVNFSLLKSFIDGGVKLPKEDYDKLMEAYRFLFEYYKLNKLSIENGRVETSFKETYLDLGLIQLINLTDKRLLEVPSYIGIFLENNKDTYPIFDVIRTGDKFSIAISEGVKGEKIGNKKNFIIVLSVLVFIFLFIGGIIVLSQKK